MVSEFSLIRSLVFMHDMYIYIQILCEDVKEHDMYIESKSYKNW